MYENKRTEPTQRFPSPHSDKINYLSNPVHRIIEQNAEKNPQGIAVRYIDEVMSYAELNRAANQLAYYLNKMQIGAEDRIVVCLEPSLNILVSLLGILKTGAVYVPLDPTYPPGRIQCILDEIKPTLVLSEQYLIERLGLHDLPFIYIGAIPYSTHVKNLSCTPEANQTAYVFFTSGSTDIPKGVLATHANLSHYTRVAIERYSMSAATVMPTIARFSFSISLFEILCPLVAGGTVIVLDRTHVVDMAKMAQTLSKVTMFHAGPSFLKNFLPYIHRKGDNVSSFTGVQHASSGGDMVPPDMLESMKKIFPNAEVFVIYGSTEIACMGCTFPVPRDQYITKTYVGQPFPNTKIRIIDTNYNQVPHGVEGEVCFSGEGLSKGYLNKSDLNKDKFLIIDGLRFYRMGDLGRINEDGDLELLGRVDSQIKIRGMSVELASVEYFLRKAPGVRDGVVTGLDLGTRGKTLIAYVVFADQNPRDIRAINAYLSYHLPDYMVPSGYVELAELPLNLNMKLDRKALHNPHGLILLRQGNEIIRVAESPTQIGLAALMQRLLATSEVGLDDNFFDLGGHSAVAIDLMIKIEETFGVSLESMDILRETVEVLARTIDKHLGREIYRFQPIQLAQSSHSIESFYFGPDESLYGAFHRPKGNIQKAVLVCCPVPYEDDRLDFVLSRLVRHLILNDIAILQFHYFGTRDSAGESAITSLGRWREDIIMASKELQQRCSETKIFGLGIRLGATLLWEARDAFQYEGMVFWDPILDGKQYLWELENWHSKIVTELMTIRNGRPVCKIHGSRELLGTTYSETSLNELTTMMFSPSKTTSTKIFWVASTERDTQFSAFQSISSSQHGCQFQSINIDSELLWLQSSKIIPDTGISKILQGGVESL